MKHTLVILSALVLAVNLGAQTPEHNNYIGINLGEGLGTLSFSPADGDHGSRLGYLVEAKYLYFFDQQFGAAVGLKYSRAYSSATFNYTQTTLNIVHPGNNNTYDATVRVDDLEERQSVGVVSLPIEFYWRNRLQDDLVLLLGAGFQIDIPLTGSYSADKGHYSVSGYFPASGVTYTDLPSYGFDRYAVDESGDIETASLGLSLVADLGVNYALRNAWSLYAGIYMGYGLTNVMSDESSRPLLSVPVAGANEANVYNGAFASNRVDAAHLFSLGIKVGINWGWSYTYPFLKKKKEEKVILK